MIKNNYKFQPKGFRSNLGWYDRGYIPHFDAGETAQFMTFRLYDSLPRSVIEEWRLATSEMGQAGEVLFRKNVERFLDTGYGQCFLGIPEVAELVENSLLFHNGKKYNLKSWVVMPNHLHFLAIPINETEIREIAHSIKSYTAQKANKLLGRSGQFWQHEPFDRYIRNSYHYSNVVDYIEMNPVKAGLCASRSEWRWSSAFQG